MMKHQKMITKIFGILAGLTTGLFVGLCVKEKFEKIYANPPKRTDDFWTD